MAFAEEPIRSETAAVGAGNGVAAVIVTYLPDLTALSSLLAVLRPQVDRTVLVDNTPVHCVPARLQALGDEWCSVIANGSNRGLATAQNQGIARARASSAKCVLLLDQDSVPASDMVERLLAAKARLSVRAARVAAIGPRWRDRHTGEDAPFVRVAAGRTLNLRCVADGAAEIECDTLVASGSLLPLDSLDAIGPMDDRLFIDQIDVEWCLRAQALGYGLFGACDAVLHHGIGDRIVRPWFARARRVPVHAPLRDYYLVRNTVDVFFRRRAPWRWRVLQLVRLPALMLVMVTQMPPRLARLRMILHGLLDGLRGRLGMAPFQSSGG